MPPTSSPSADQLALRPPDERIADFSSLQTWVKSGLNAAMYKGLLGATYIHVWDGRTWKRILNWTLAPHVGEVKPGQGKDRAYVLSLADAFIVKHLAQVHAALTSAVVTDPKFKAGFASFVVKYRLQEQREQRVGLAAGLAALRENAAAASAAWTQGRERAGFAAWKQAARKQAAWKQALAGVSARWTQGRERANAAAGFAAWREKATAAAEAKAATAACDAAALTNGIEGLALKTPAKRKSMWLERVRTPKAGDSPSPRFFKSSPFKVKKPLQAQIPFLDFPAGNNECMTRPAGAANNTSYIDKAVRRLSTGFGRKVRIVEQAPPKEGEAPFINNHGEAVTPGAPEIGAPMESSLQLRKKWQDSPQSLGPKKCYALPRTARVATLPQVRSFSIRTTGRGTIRSARMTSSATTAASRPNRSQARARTRTPRTSKTRMTG